MLLEATNKGYGKHIIDVAWNSPDFDMIANLNQNVYQFSAAKNYHELKDFTTALKDGDRVRTFSEYKIACDDINAKYNSSWLLTEYNQAIASGQMASRWTDFTANKKAMPFLQYQTVGDSKVRPEHAILNGIIKNIDDVFWNTYYPPNGWGDRCDAIQLTSKNAKETDTSKIELPEIPKMWRINVGKEGVVFPTDSAYFIDIPKDLLDTDVKKELNHYYRKQVDQWINDNLVKGTELIEAKNTKTGGIALSRNSLKTVADHLTGADKMATTHLSSVITELKLFKKNVPLDNKPNKQAKIKRGVLNYNYYTVTIEKVKFVVYAEEYKNFEKLYAMKKKA